MPVSICQCRFLSLQVGWTLGWTIALTLLNRMSAPVLGVLVLVGALAANELTPPLGTARTRVRWFVLVLLFLSLITFGYLRFGFLVRGVL